MTVEEKQCSHCKEWKSRSDFHKSKIGKDGLHPQCRECRREYNRERLRTDPAFKQRVNALQKENRKKHLETDPEYSQRENERAREYYKTKTQYRERKRNYHETNRERISKYRKEHYENNRDDIIARRRELDTINPERLMLNYARARAKKKGFEFNLTLDDIKIPTHCPFLHIPLFRGSDKICDNSPSLDRINSKLGYVKGNVIVISYKANRMKNDGTLEEMYSIAGALEALRDQNMSFSDHLERIRNHWSDAKVDAEG